MTQEQLHEIEQMLAKFWSGSIPYSPKHGVELADLALTLVNALREAWADVERLKSALHPTRHDPETCCCPDCCTLRQVTEERDLSRTEVDRLRKLLNPAPKPDPSDTLLRLMKAEQRREIYRQAWEAAILEGKERNEAHRIAAEAADAVVSLEEI